MLGCFLDVLAFVFGPAEQFLNDFLELVGGPIKILDFHDEDGLEGVDGLLPQLP